MANTINALTEQIGTTGQDIQNIYSEAIGITKPAFQEAKQDISSLLSQARSQFSPVGTTARKQLEGVVSGQTDITSLPGFQAKSRALQNMLGATGQTQSRSGTLAAYEPLIASEYESLSRRAESERSLGQQQEQLLAGLFGQEAQLMGQLPIKEASMMTNILGQQAQSEQSILNLLTNTGIAGERIALQREKFDREDEAAQGQMWGNLGGIGFDFITDLFGGDGGGSDSEGEAWANQEGNDWVSPTMDAVELGADVWIPGLGRGIDLFGDFTGWW